MHLCNCSTPGFRQIGCAAFYSHHPSHPAGLCVFGYSYTMYRVGYWRRCGTSGLRVYISVREASCRWCVSERQPACQKSLAEFAARRPRIRFDPFFAAAPPKGTSVGRVRREKYFARRECVFAHFMRTQTRGSERNLFCQKRAPPFFDKLTQREGLSHSLCAFSVHRGGILNAPAVYPLRLPQRLTAGRRCPPPRPGHRPASGRGSAA